MEVKALWRSGLVKGGNTFWLLHEYRRSDNALVPDFARAVNHGANQAETWMRKMQGPSLGGPSRTALAEVARALARSSSGRMNARDTRSFEASKLENIEDAVSPSEIAIALIVCGNSTVKPVYDLFAMT